MGARRYRNATMAMDRFIPKPDWLAVDVDNM
jgi:hypothetical protein